MSGFFLGGLENFSDEFRAILTFLIFHFLKQWINEFFKELLFNLSFEFAISCCGHIVKINNKQLRVNIRLFLPTGRQAYELADQHSNILKNVGMFL